MVRHMARSILGAIVLTTLVVGPASAGSTALLHRPILSLDGSTSSNWSGYGQGTLEQGNNKQFSSVSGIWRVPKATQHKSGEAEYSSTWVGIGGGCVNADCSVTDSTLIQAGTEQDVNADGSGSYSAWTEIIPQPSVPIPNFPVKPGDKMRVTITETSPFMWDMVVENLTTHQKVTVSTPYSSTHATAEWIVETPVVVDTGGNVTIGPLPKLSRVHIDRAMTNGANAHVVATEEIQLVDPNSSQVLATPSAPDTDADGFNDCTYATTCSAPPRS
jgi:hypothetical protein